MREVVIVEAVRTPVGRKNGWLREIHPVRLGSYALCEALATPERLISPTRTRARNS